MCLATSAYMFISFPAHYPIRVYVHAHSQPINVDMCICMNTSRC